MDIIFDKINILLIVTVCLNLILGVIIFLNGRKKKINFVYGLNILVIIAWVLMMIFFRSADQSSDLFWCTLLYIMPTMTASSFLYFTYIFPSKIDKNVLLKSIVIFFINLLIIILIAWPGLVIKEVNVRPGLEKEIIFGKFYFLYFLYISNFFSYGFLRLFRKYLKTTGIERLQVIYLLSGYALAANLAFVTNLIMPWLGYFFLNWLGQVFTITMVGFTAYAILKYRLMDIRIVTRRFFIYFFVGAFAYGFFYFLVWFYNRAFGSVFSIGAYATGLVMVPIFLLLFYSLNRFLRVFANKHLFASLYNYQETISKLIDELNHYIDLDKIIDLIVDTIKRTMQLNRAGVLLVNNQKTITHYKIAKVIGFNRQNGISLVEDNFLTKYLQDNQKPLVRDELEWLVRDAVLKDERRSFKKLHEHMKKIEAALCLPLLSQKKLIGIIVLGSKKTGDAYTKEDLELLNVLSKQAGIAVENAMLYKEVQKKGFLVEQQREELSGQNEEIKKQKEELAKLNDRLKEKVSDQGRDIKDKNRYLEELLNMKSDFLRVVSHQLNTPVSVIRGACSMIEEDKGYTDKGLEAINAGVTRIYDTMSDFWRAYQIEGQRMDLDLDLVDVEKIVNEQIEEKKVMDILKQRKLKLAVKKSKKMVDGIPQAYCDKKNLVHVISNLLDNAIFYTEKGGVTIIYDKVHRFDGAYLKISISDTGVGIPEGDREHIYKKFGRGKNAQLVHPDGSGLGLYIAKKIIEDTGGEFMLEKTKLGEGSVFSFTLPLFDINNTVNNKNKKRRKETYNDILQSKTSGHRFSKDDNTKPTVLLVEDEKHLIEMYHDYLKKHSYDFYNTSNIDEAMVLVKTVKPDIILLDIIIPKEDEGGMIDIVAEQGWEFLRAIKENEEYKDIPVLVFTNLNSDEDKEKAKKLGATRFLFKAKVMPKDVIRIIDEVLSV